MPALANSDCIEGELADLIDEFSDGKIQFSFLKIKDSNTGLPKSVLIAWCGEGVPERVKGYFTGHVSAVAKVLHGYHVQITARSDRDLTPESIVQKVADSSGSKYSAGSNAPVANAALAPPIATKPAFTPTRVGGTSSFKPLGGARGSTQTDESNDGWGQDAPQVYRTQLEKVEPAYKPTKVNIAELRSQSSSSASVPQPSSSDRPDVVRGAYQPIGKVDIAEIRRQARESGQVRDERPDTVKGAYEPVGKVDIAAIRARAQPPRESAPEEDEAPTQPTSSAPAPSRPDYGSVSADSSGRLTSLPKPKVAGRFGSSGNFGGTKPPVPAPFGGTTAPTAAPVGTASKTFADEGGKTPAQIWAEKKARERAASGSGQTPSFDRPAAAPLASQTSGNSQWKSSYAGKSWAPIQTNATGISRTSAQDGTDDVPREETEEEHEQSSGGVNALKDRFKGAVPMGAPSLQKAPASNEYSAPALPSASKPSASGPGGGIAIPGMARPPPPQPEEHEAEEPEPEESYVRPPPPPQQARSPTPPSPELRPSSPIRVAMPVGRSAAPLSPPEERYSPEPVPARSMAQALPTPSHITDDHDSHDQARAAAANVAQNSSASHAGHGVRATALYDYVPDESNEIALQEGEEVTNIDQVDPDWWVGTNSKGQEGLFPANYVEIIEGGSGPATATHLPPAPAPAPAAPAAAPAATSPGVTATAIYDYTAEEDNELTFPDGAKISNIVSSSTLDII
jgi:hypothetical protein